MKVGSSPLPRRTGRPLSYDRDAALEAAMMVFWRSGYETTSVADLTAAMGMSAPSLYAAFGDKKRLFLEAVRRYSGDPEAVRRTIAGASTSRDAARDFLTAAALSYTSEDTPRGCLLASATASGSPASAEVQHIVAELRKEVEASLRYRVERDIAEGVLPAETHPTMLSGLVMAVTQGMSVLARDGAPRDHLLGIVDAALQAWPRLSQNFGFPAPQQANPEAPRRP